MSGPVRVPGDTEMWLSLDWSEREVKLTPGQDQSLGLATWLHETDLPYVVEALKQAVWTLEGVAGAAPQSPVTCDRALGTITLGWFTFSAVQCQNLVAVLLRAQASFQSGVGEL